MKSVLLKTCTRLFIVNAMALDNLAQGEDRTVSVEYENDSLRLYWCNHIVDNERVILRYIVFISDLGDPVNLHRCHGSISTVFSDIWKQ